jgi:hypothetical protein
MAVRYIVWNMSQNRQEVGAMFPSLSDANTFIDRYKKSGPPRSAGPVPNLVAVQVES